MADIEDHDLHPRRSKLISHHHVLETIAGDDVERRHHGYILSGPKGIGKATCAFKVAEKLFSIPQEAGLFGDAVSEPSEDDPEVRLIRAGSHPDLMVIEADQSKATASISVDQIRSVIPFLSHTPSRGSWRIVIIDALDEMNINGANAILKTLEEPPEKAIVMMINHRSKPVLPTIRSRAQMIHMTPLGFEETRQVIRTGFAEADQDWIDVAAALCDGAPGLASLFAQSGAVDLYAETTQMLAGFQTDKQTLDALSAQWGAGGAKNLVRRQMGQMLMLRFLTMAARLGVGQNNQEKPRLDIEDRALGQICGRHQPWQLADWHLSYRNRMDEAMRLNLDLAPVFYDLFDQLMAHD